MDLTLDGVGTRLGGRWVVDGIDATPPTGHLTGLLGRPLRSYREFATQITASA